MTIGARAKTAERPIGAKATSEERAFEPAIDDRATAERETGAPDSRFIVPGWRIHGNAARIESVGCAAISQGFQTSPNERRFLRPAVRVSEA